VIGSVLSTRISGLDLGHRTYVFSISVSRLVDELVSRQQTKRIFPGTCVIHEQNQLGDGDKTGIGPTKRAATDPVTFRISL